MVALFVSKTAWLLCSILDFNVFLLFKQAHASNTIAAHREY